MTSTSAFVQPHTPLRQPIGAKCEFDRARRPVGGNVERRLARSSFFGAGMPSSSAGRRHNAQQGGLPRHEDPERAGVGSVLAGAALQLPRHWPKPGQPRRRGGERRCAGRDRLACKRIQPPGCGCRFQLWSSHGSEGLLQPRQRRFRLPRIGPRTGAHRPSNPRRGPRLFIPFPFILHNSKAFPERRSRPIRARRTVAAGGRIRRRTKARSGHSRRRSLFCKANLSRCSKRLPVGLRSKCHDTGQRDATLEALHTTATEIFTGALKACSIESAIDRRIRFEGNTLHRLLPDGSGPETINLACYKRIFIIALGKAAGPMLDTLLERMSGARGCAESVARTSCPRQETGGSATLRAVIRCQTKTPLPRRAPRWPC